MTGSSFTATITAIVKGLIAQIRIIAIVAAAVVAVLGLVSFFTAHPLVTFLRLVSFAGVGLMLFAVAVMILTFKKAREVAPAALLASLVAALAGTSLSLALAPTVPHRTLVVFALIVGGVIGALWSRTTLLFVDGRSIRMRGTIWYLAVWALTLALSQGVAIVTGRTPLAVTLLALAGAGIAVGNTLGIILRTRKAAALLLQAGGKSHV